jgi:acetylserotonin N-methyltransferase
MEDETRVYDAYIAGRQSAALAAAVRLGVFDALAPGPRAPQELATALGVAPRPLGHLTRALVAMGLLQVREGGRLALAPDAQRHLLRDRPGSLAGLIDLEVENFLSPQLLLEAIRADAPAVYGGADPWTTHASDPARARAFTSAMHAISALPAEALARAVDCSQGGRLLDLGGGSGALAIALARNWPRLHCVVADLPAVCALAREHIRAARLERRVTTAELDFFCDPLPGGNDWVLLSQVLHDWPPERGAELLRRAAGALRPGGWVCIHEKLVGEGGGGPLANALVDLDMLVWTHGQQYSLAALRALLEACGFEPPACRSTHGYWSLVEARLARR